MIRINLLDGLPRGRAVQAKLRRGGASAFLSGREAVLGGLFLGLGFVILAVIFVLAPSDGPSNTLADSEGGAADATLPEATSEVAPGRASDSVPGPASEPEPLIVADVIVPPSMVPQVEPKKPNPMAERGPATAAADAPPSDAPPSDAPPAAGPSTTPGPGWDAAARVTKLEVNPLGRQLEIFLGVEQGEVDISTFNLDNPGRIVVDVKNARLETSTRRLTVNHPLLQKIRIAQNLFDPPRVRLVMDVGDIPDMVIVDRSGGFVFLVTPDE